MTLLLTLACFTDVDNPPVTSTPGTTTTTTTATTPTNGTGLPTGSPPPLVDVWQDCPAATSYVGNSGWTASLTPAGQLWCAPSIYGRSPLADLQAKAMLQVLDGTWALPDAAGNSAVALPVCLRESGTEVLGPTLAGAGGTSTQVMPQGSEDRWTWSVTHSMTATDASPWDLLMKTEASAGTGAVPAPITWDGAPYDAEAREGTRWYWFPDGGRTFDDDAVELVPCAQVGTPVHAHSVTFDGGDVTFRLALPESLAHGLVLEASGTLDGKPFTQASPWRLVASPQDEEWLERDFALLFDEAIGGVCGISVTGLTEAGDSILVGLALTDCELNVLDQRGVLTQAWALE